MSAKRESSEKRSQDEEKTQGQKTGTSDRMGGPMELVALLRLLTREPPPGHDFKTCPICKRYGITGI